MLGLQFSVDSEFEIAESLLRKATEAAPGDVAARIALSRAFAPGEAGGRSLGELDGLTDEAGQSLTALSLRASVLRDLGRQEEEVAILRRLASSQPRPEKLSDPRGHAFRTLGQNADAVAAYRKVLAAAPHEGTSWWARPI